ncbi:MAG: hypothetical protein Ta2B_23250 [Termitinemataceae bacterium]|nr:MAG: hypothetical protein Ta2B_23250 [Termitinemataceae bacterium]
MVTSSPDGDATVTGTIMKPPIIKCQSSALSIEQRLAVTPIDMMPDTNRQVPVAAIYHLNFENPIALFYSNRSANLQDNKNPCRRAAWIFVVDFFLNLMYTRYMMKKNTFAVMAISALILVAGVFLSGCNATTRSTPALPVPIYNNVKKLTLNGIDGNGGVKLTIGYDIAGVYASEKYKSYTQNKEDTFPKGIDVFYKSIFPNSNPPMFKVQEFFENNTLQISIARIEDISSGGVNSMDKMSLQYGKIEASIKIDSTKNGLWPVFRMISSNYVKNNDRMGYGEIVIMEMGHEQGIINGKQDKYFSGAARWEASTAEREEKLLWSEEKLSRSIADSESFISDFVTYSEDVNLQDGKFHTYTLVWNTDIIEMYLDNSSTPYFSMPVTREIASRFAQPFYFGLNLAAGGTLPNIFDMNEVTALNDRNSYIANMYVDYVKVYSAKGVLLAELSDEFDGEELDIDKWNVEESSAVSNEEDSQDWQNGEVQKDNVKLQKSNVRLQKNGELQTYSSENVTVASHEDKGCLILTAKR